MRRVLHGPRAYFLREALELAVLIGLLWGVQCFHALPISVWIGVPTAKVLFSILFYFLFLRRLLTQPSHHGPSQLIGRIGVVVSQLKPEGQIRIRGELWTATSVSGSSVGLEEEVRVLGVSGRVLVVEAIEPIRGSLQG